MLIHRVGLMGIKVQHGRTIQQLHERYVFFVFIERLTKRFQVGDNRGTRVHRRRRRFQIIGQSDRQFLRS